MTRQIAITVAASVFLLQTALAATVPDPAIDAASEKGAQTAVLAGGCFWCTEGVFEHVTGVRKVVSGYAGGDAKDADYKKVSEGRTAHAEAIEITYDPAKITYGQLLKIFFSVAHDPTQLNRQGPDHGKQYRSAIFFRTPEQKQVAEEYIKQLSKAKVYSAAIVTEISPLTKFYPAEEYHQNFVARNPDHPYVVQHALPKIKKLKTEFASAYKN